MGSIHFSHAALALGAGACGVLAGFGLGWLLASLARRFVPTGGVTTIIPWRSVLLGLVPLRIHISVLLFTWFGIGRVSEAFLVALTICLVSMVLSASILLQHWRPASLRQRLLSAGRTCLVLALFLVPNMMGSSSLGNLMSAKMRRHGLWDLEGVLGVWLVLLVVAVIVDLVLGLVQVALGDRESPA